MEMSAAVPAVAAAIACLLRSPRQAFIAVFLPVLLLVPDHLRWFVPGLPDIGFQHAAILPIALLAPLLSSARWTWSWTDALVVLYAAIVGYSEYLAAGWWDAQNLLFDVVCKLVLPYAVAKRCLTSPEADGRFARTFVALLAVVMVLSLWEFRMGTRLFFDEFWATFFPYAPARPVQYRWGFGRIGGPYEHAILAGIVFAVAILLAVWLRGTRQWKHGLVGWGMLGAVLAGSVMTMSRGPWLGLVVGGAIAFLGYARSRRQAVLLLAALALVALPPAVVAFDRYLGGQDLGLPGALQASAQYRAELIPLYWPVVMERPLLGWGSRFWPKDDAQPSVDNEFLLQALEHGLVSLAVFAAILLLVALRLAVWSSRRPTRSRSGALGFTLLAIIVSYIVALATVWLGAQTQTVLFMVLGWSEALVARVAQEAPAPRPAAVRAGAPRPFARVLGGR